MHRNKIFDILENLSLKDTKAFQIHYKKNYPKRNIEGGILEQLVKLHPHFGKNRKDLAATYQKIFPANISEKIRSNTLNKLVDPLEDFLLLQLLQKNSFERNHLLAKVYKRKGLNKLVLKNWKAIDSDLGKRKVQEIWNWTERMKRSHETYFNPHNNHIKDGPDLLYNALDQLRFFHTAAQLRYACELYSRHNILKEPKPLIPDLEDCLNFALNSPSNFLQSYALTLQLIRNKEQGNYAQTRDKILTHFDEFHGEDQHLLINYLSNHIALKIRNGQQKFLKEQFELVKFYVPKKVFITDGYYNYVQFINIIHIAILMQDIDWVENFIKKRKAYLAEKTKAHVLILSNALVLFAKKEFKEVALQMHLFRSGEVLLEMWGRWLALQANYDLGEREELENLLDNLEIFIRRKKSLLNASLLKSGLSVVHFIRRLIKPKVDKIKLKKDLENTKLVYIKNWLLEKIEALD